MWSEAHLGAAAHELRSEGHDQKGLAKRRIQLVTQHLELPNVGAEEVLGTG